MNPRVSWSARLRLSCVILVALAAPVLAAPAVEPDRAVLLISIDGLHPSYLLEAERFGVNAPVLRQFISKGAYAQRVLNVSPTVTYPNHTALVTGLSPQEHGIYTNTVFDPMGLEQGAWNWYGAQIKAPTLWDAAKAKGQTTAAVLWPVSVAHAAIDYNVPEYWRNKRPYDHYLMQAVSTPRGFLEQVEKSSGQAYHADVDGLVLDGKTTDVAVAMIEQARPQLLTVHIVALDSAQHDHGPLNEYSVPVLEKIDALVGRMIDAQLKAYPDATIAIASDHGFLPVNHLVNLNAALADAGLIELSEDHSPKLKSWKAYAWNSGGSASVVLQDPQDEATRAKVDRLLSDLAADPGNGIADVLRGAEAIAAGALPQASFLVDCNSGFATGGALTGAVVTATAKTTGTHGYLNTHPEMSSSFFVMGPGIKAGKNLGQIDIRAIAPTLARELQLQLPTARYAPLPLRD